MFAIAIDRTDHRCKAHAALAGDLIQTVPELVFDADTRFVAWMSIERFETGDTASTLTNGPAILY